MSAVALYLLYFGLSKIATRNENPCIYMAEERCMCIGLLDSSGTESITTTADTSENERNSHFRNFELDGVRQQNVVSRVNIRARKGLRHRYRAWRQSETRAYCGGVSNLNLTLMYYPFMRVHSSDDVTTRSVWLLNLASA